MSSLGISLCLGLVKEPLQVGKGTWAGMLIAARLVAKLATCTHVHVDQAELVHLRVQGAHGSGRDRRRRSPLLFLERCARLVAVVTRVEVRVVGRKLFLRSILNGV